MQNKITMIDVGILVKMVYPFSIERRCAPLNAVNNVTFSQRRHLVVGRLLFRSQRLHLAELGPPLRVERQHLVEVQLEMFPGNRCADHVRGFAEEFWIKHNAGSVAAPPEE